MKWEPAKKLEATKTWIKGDARSATKQFWREDMRWSYVASGVLVIVGAIVNLLFFSAHGWTVWPFVVAAAIIMMVHEAAERNGHGVPPLHVYALFFGAIAAWVIVMAILSITNPLIVILAIAGLSYYCGKAFIKQREHTKVIEKRRAEGKCIYCGEIADVSLGVCMSCGNDPDPATTQLSRVASMVKGAKQTDRARAVIQGETLAAIAARKEKYLVMNKPRKSNGRKK